MENVVIKSNELQKIIEESIPTILKEKFSSSYNNPLSDAITKELTEQSGMIRQYIKELILEILTNDELKKKVANEIIAQMIQKGFKN